MSQPNPVTESEPRQRMSVRPEWMIVLVGGLLRLACLGLLTQTPLWEYFRADHAFYKAWGLSIADGQLSPGHVFEQGPLYAYWLGAIYSCVGDLDWIVISIQMLAGVHLGCLVYWIGRRIGGEQLGFWAGLLTVVYGPLLYYEGLIMKSWLSPWGTAAACLLTLQLFDCVRGRDDGTQSTDWRGLILLGGLAGVLTGLLCLVRESHVLMLLPIAGVIGLGLKTLSRLARLGLIAAAFGSCLLVTLPATVHNWYAGSQLVWVTSGGGEVLFMGWGPEATGYYQNPSFVRPDPFLEHEDFRLEASRRLGRPVTYTESSKFWTRSAISEATTHIPRSLDLLVRKAVILLNDYEVPDSDFYSVAQRVHPLLAWLPTFSLLAGIAVVGLCVGLLIDRRFIIPISFAAVHVATVLITYNFSRFRLGLMPFVCLFAATGACSILRGTAGGPNFLRGFPARLMMTVTAILISLWSWMPPPAFQEMEFAILENEFLEKLEERKPYYEQASALTLEQEGKVDSADAAFELGIAWLNALQTFRAESWLKRGLQIDPGHADCWFYLGVIHARRGEFKEAGAAFRKAADYDSENADVYANLGSVQFHLALSGHLTLAERQERLEQAKVSYRRGLEAEPGNTACRQGLQAVEYLLAESSESNAK